MRMGKNVVLILVCFLASCTICTGCGEEDPLDAPGQPEQREKDQSDESPSYMGELQKGLKKGKEEPNLLALQNEIKQYQAIKGKWPESLKEFAEWRNAPLPDLPKGRTFQYDAETGKITIIDAE